MAGLNAEFAPKLQQHLLSNQALVAENFNQCFDVDWQVAAENATAWDSQASDADGPGVACLLEVNDAAAVVLIPDALLPGWYRHPNDSETARLDTLAMEWGINLFPPEMETTRSSSFRLERLHEYLSNSLPSPDASVIPLRVSDSGGSEVGLVQLVWPVTAPNWEPVQIASSPPVAAAGTTVPASAPQPPPPAPSQAAGQPDPYARLRRLPVTVSVRLTEKRISISQLLAITPGALLTFNKSCDDLLDMYVNNALYCRGEAVKIGESFGLKVNEVGIYEERKSKLYE